MRVAFSGTHRTGKSTLLEAIAELVPAYVAFDEPYRILEDAGHDFSDPPSAEDFEAQLRTSIALLGDAPADALLDRCPLDFIAYLHALDEDVEDWIDDVRDAMAQLDLVVVVPIETPDRIAVPAHEDRRLRRRVDEHLQRMVLGFEVETLEVAGSLAERVEQVARAMRVHDRPRR